MLASERRRAVWSVYLVGVVDCADAALLPGCFRSLERELGLTPSTLAQLVLAQSVAGALACPVWGHVVDTDAWERRDLLVFGCLWWAIASVLSGISVGFWQLLLARTLLGVALPLVSPLSQSIIADLFDEQNRGKAFGTAAMWCTIGTALGGIGGTALSNHRVPLPVLGVTIAGWRAVFLIGGMVCALVAGHVAWTCPKFPRCSDSGSVSTEARSSCSIARGVARNRTWQLLTGQSMFGGLPFAGFHFLTLLMQYAGYQDAVAAVLLGSHRVGSAAGSILGGHIGDIVAAAGYNRVRVAQGSVAWLLLWLLVLIAALERNVAAASSVDSHTPPVSPLMLALILFTWGVGGTSLSCFGGNRQHTTIYLSKLMLSFRRCFLRGWLRSSDPSRGSIWVRRLFLASFDDRVQARGPGNRQSLRRADCGESCLLLAWSPNGDLVILLPARASTSGYVGGERVWVSSDH